MNNLTLEVLEAYAKVLSEKQANKLYESKTKSNETIQRNIKKDNKTTPGVKTGTVNQDLYSDL